LSNVPFSECCPADVKRTPELKSQAERKIVRVCAQPGFAAAIASEKRSASAMSNRRAMRMVHTVSWAQLAVWAVEQGLMNADLAP
jgi:hypothetical protein